MAVLGAVAMMVAVGTLVLLGTVEEGPTAVTQGANAFTRTWARGMENKGVNIKRLHPTMLHFKT